jgi:hypothetical protein
MTPFDIFISLVPVLYHEKLVQNRAIHLLGGESLYKIDKRSNLSLTGVFSSYILEDGHHSAVFACHDGTHTLPVYCDKEVCNSVLCYGTLYGMPIGKQYGPISRQNLHPYGKHGALCLTCVRYP